MEKPLTQGDCFKFTNLPANYKLAGTAFLYPSDGPKAIFDKLHLTIRETTVVEVIWTDWTPTGREEKTTGVDVACTNYPLTGIIFEVKRYDTLDGNIVATKVGDRQGREISFFQCDTATYPRVDAECLVTPEMVDEKIRRAAQLVAAKIKCDANMQVENARGNYYACGDNVKDVSDVLEEFAHLILDIARGKTC